MKLGRSWPIGLAVGALLAWTVFGATAAPKGKLVIGLSADPTTFDPHVTSGFPMAQTWPLVFDTLLSRDHGGKITPSLATSWRWVSPTVLELKIREGIKFPNGEILDAHAVKYSLERILDPKLKSQLRTLFKSVDRVEAADAHTVRIHNKRPDSFLISALADWGAIVPPKYYQGHDPKHLARNPMGSGPYRLAKWKKSEELVFEANPGYWDPSRQRVKTGVIKVIPETTTRVSALVAGSVDIVDAVPPQMVPMIKANPKVEAVAGPGAKACFIAMVIKDGAPWSKLEVRKALNLGVDKESIVKNVLEGYGKVEAGQIVSPASYGHNPALEPYPYDPAQAKKLLAEAGYPSGFEVEMFVPLGRYLKGTEAAEAVAGQLAKVGVKVRVRTLEYGAWRQNSLARWQPHVKPFWTYSCRNDLPLHASYMYEGAIHSKSLHGGVRDKDIDKLVDEALADTDDENRLKRYQDLNRTIREQALVVFLYHLDQISAKNKRVGWQMRANESLLLSDAWLKD